MNTTLEVLKEIYLEEIEKLKNLPFYQYYYQERKVEVKKASIGSIIDAQDISGKIEKSLEGKLLSDIKEKLGHKIVDDIKKIAVEYRSIERDKGVSILNSEREKIEGNEYRYAIEFLCRLLLIKNLEENLLSLKVKPTINIDGKIMFNYASS